MEKLDLEKCHKLIIEAYCCSGGIERAQVIIQDEPPHQPREPSQSLSWCICGKCQSMGQPIENVCCRRSDCVTNLEAFETIVLDVNVLSVAIISRSDIFADDPEYTLASYRKAAYRQYTMWIHGYLGRGNRQVIPSCVVWAVRRRYPDPHGIYLGFREY